MTKTISQRTAELRNSFDRLVAMAARPEEEATRDSTIKKFEITFELAWKVLKDINDAKGLSAANPKDTIRLAGQNGVIDDVDLWLNFLKRRNEASHLYEEEMAKNLYSFVKGNFIGEIAKLLERVEKMQV